MKKTENSTLTKSCAICKRPQLQEFRPFCSRRCADVDLQRWFSGSYAIPVVELGEGDHDDNNDE